jgi:hypothetical protein
MYFKIMRDIDIDIWFAFHKSTYKDNE